MQTNIRRHSTDDVPAEVEDAQRDQGYAPTAVVRRQGGSFDVYGHVAVIDQHDDRHCGSANYETFTIAVVVENDRQLIAEARAVVAQGAEEQRSSDSPRPNMGAAADAVRAWVEEKFIDPVCQEGATHHGIAATLCNAALGAVDWMELAEEWMKPEGA